MEQSALAGTASQSQQWLLRPAFFRGIDNALLEKQEAARIAAGPGSRDFGYLSVLVQTHAHAEILFPVGRDAHAAASPAQTRISSESTTPRTRQVSVCRTLL